MAARGTQSVALDAPACPNPACWFQPSCGWTGRADAFTPQSRTSRMQPGPGRLEITRGSRAWPWAR